jgi:hypothetical protein
MKYCACVAGVKVPCCSGLHIVSGYVHYCFAVRCGPCFIKIKINKI